MKRTAIVAALAAALLIPAGTASAFAVTPSATNLTVGDTLTVTVDSAGSFVQGGWIWQGASTTGACTSVRSGSYTNGGQVITYTCTGPDVLTAVAASYGTFSLPTGTITVVAAPVVTPPPAPAPKISSSVAVTATTAVVTLTNTGTADWSGTWTDAVYTPRAGTTVVAPAFASCGPRYLRNRITHALYVAPGFVCTGGSLAVGATTTLTVTR